LRALDLVRREGGPGRGRRFGRRRPPGSRSLTPCLDASSSCSRRTGASAISCAGSHPPTCAWCRAAPRSRRRTGAGCAVAKALAPPAGCRGVVPAARACRRGRRFSGRGRRPIPSAVAVVAERLAARLAESPPGFLVLRKLGPTPPGFPRRTGVAAEASARVASF
jgi:hypothetical protein